MTYTIQGCGELRMHHPALQFVLPDRNCILDY